LCRVTTKYSRVVRMWLVPSHRFGAQNFWDDSYTFGKLLNLYQSLLLLQRSAHNMLNIYTGLFKMIVGVLTTCHTQYTSDSSICLEVHHPRCVYIYQEKEAGSV
jgi:hypothetical protein